MGFWSTLAKVGGIAAAPFTGGLSIPIGQAVGGAIDRTAGTIAGNNTGPGLNFAGGLGGNLGAVIGAGAGALGNVLGQTAGARTQSTAIPGQYQTLADLLRGRAEDRLRQSADISGYKSQGLQDINSAFQNIGQSVNNNLTARGLATSPVAGAVTANLNAARGAGLAQFMNSLPLLQRQLQAQDIGIGQSVLGPQLGRTAPGSALATGLQSIPGLLGALNGAGVFGPRQAPGAVPLPIGLPQLPGAGGDVYGAGTYFG